MASFLARALQLSAPGDTSTGRFQDTRNNSHYDNIRAIAAAGITLGCDPNGDYYCPERFVTRAEMASFLTRAFKLPTPGDTSTGRFQDTTTSSHYDNIRAIAAAGITLGCNPTGALYCPERFVTRAEMASFLTRALQRTGAGRS